MTRIDRLARSMRDLQIIADRLKQKGVLLVATEQPADSSTASGKAFFDMLGVFVEFKTSLRRERRAEGIAVAKTKGIYKGRPLQIDMGDIKRRLSEGERPVDVARDIGVAPSTVYKVKGQVVA